MTADQQLQRLGRLQVHDSPQAVAAAGARLLQDAAASAIADHGVFSIALAGGSTPRMLYQILAAADWRRRTDWEAWRVYFGDERAVPPDDEQSNYRMAADALLRHVPIAAGNVHRMQGEFDPDEAASAYHDVLAATLPLTDAGVPRLDLVLLGIGENGHTASLFPGTPALEVTQRWATRGRADYAPYDRITMTFPVLNAASMVVFTVTGGSKHRALHATAEGTTPAARVRPGSGSAHWILDRAASGAANG